MGAKESARARARASPRPKLARFRSIACAQQTGHDSSLLTKYCEGLVSKWPRVGNDREFQRVLAKGNTFHTTRSIVDSRSLSRDLSTTHSQTPNGDSSIVPQSAMRRRWRRAAPESVSSSLALVVNRSARARARARTRESERDSGDTHDARARENERERDAREVLSASWDECDTRSSESCISTEKSLTFDRALETSELQVARVRNASRATWTARRFVHTARWRALSLSRERRGEIASADPRPDPKDLVEFSQTCVFGFGGAALGCRDVGVGPRARDGVVAVVAADQRLGDDLRFENSKRCERFLCETPL